MKVTDLVYEGDDERVFSWDSATVTRELGDLVNGLVVAIPDILLVIVTERDCVKESVLVKETEVVLVNGLVVGIPERVIVKELVCERVIVTDLVYEGDGERVFS